MNDHNLGLTTNHPPSPRCPTTHRPDLGDSEVPDNQRNHRPHLPIRKHPAAHERKSGTRKPLADYRTTGPREVGLREAGPVVAHAQHAVAQADRHLAVLRAPLARVVEQVGDGAADPLGVAALERGSSEVT